MKRITTLLTILVLLSNLFLVSCGGTESGKSSSKGDQDFSSSGMIKDIEEMQKAAEGSKPAAPAQPASTQQPAAPPAQR